MYIHKYNSIYRKYRFYQRTLGFTSISQIFFQIYDHLVTQHVSDMADGKLIGWQPAIGWFPKIPPPVRPVIHGDVEGWLPRYFKSFQKGCMKKCMIILEIPLMTYQHFDLILRETDDQESKQGWVWRTTRALWDLHLTECLQDQLFVKRI